MARPFENELTWYDQPEEKLIRNGGFSGCDIDIVVRLPGTYDRRGRVLSQPIVYQLGSLQTLSYQSYNSKEAVRSLGFKNVRGYARGSRTIAGTLMFNQLYTHVLDDVGNASIVDDARGILTYSSGSVTYYRNTPVDPKIQEAIGDNYNFETPSVRNRRHNFDFSWDQNTIGRHLKASDLPPFDIIAIFVNEYGHVGKMIIYGVDLVTEGGVLSIEDIYTEVSMQYVARDIEYFHSESGPETRQWRGISPFNQGILGGGGEVRGGEVQFVMNSMDEAIRRVHNSVNTGQTAGEVFTYQQGAGEEGNVNINSLLSPTEVVEQGALRMEALDAFQGAGTMYEQGRSNIQAIRRQTRYRDSQTENGKANIRTIIGDNLRFTSIRLLYRELEQELQLSLNHSVSYDTEAAGDINRPLHRDDVRYMLEYLRLIDINNTVPGSGE
jgi:hypothetical protein